MIPQGFYQMRWISLVIVTMIFTSSTVVSTVVVAEGPGNSTPQKKSTLGGLLGQFSKTKIKLVQFTSKDSNENGQQGPQLGTPQDQNSLTPSISATDSATQPIATLSSADQAQLNSFLRAAAGYERSGNYVAAEQQYQLAVDFHPTDLKTLLSYGRLILRQGKLEAAIIPLKKATSIHPQNPIPHNDLGLLYARSNQFDKSLASIYKAIKLEPDNKRYRNNMANVLFEANRLKEAHSQFAYAHGTAVAHYNIAFLLQRRGDQELAKSHLQEALSQKVDFEEAEALLTLIENNPAESARVATKPSASIPSSSKQGRLPPSPDNLTSPKSEIKLLPPTGKTPPTPQSIRLLPPVRN
ncbi:MAG: hypothetical protein COA78_03595 [Blastopirellula sp.]|nr:MAG: hypothetical protein COA78_03595 [Blastopirellula sp.]